MNVKKASFTIIFSVLLSTALVMPVSGSAAAASSDAAVSPRAIEPSLAKTVAAAMFEHKEKKIFLVDVRPAAEFEKYHIPGSLNISLHALKAKAFLKSKPTVLVNAGYVVGPLAETCRALRKEAYKAYVLAGGLCAWKAAGGALTGDPFAQGEMNVITADQFQRETAFGKQIVAHLSDKKAVREAATAPGAKILPLSDPKRTVSSIKSWIEAKDAGPFTRVVVMTDTGRENRRIQRWLADGGLHRQVYILRGGLQAYQKHLEFEQLAKRPKKERKKSIGRCPACQNQE
jgi:rhodanese-related sulfurtransferase